MDQDFEKWKEDLQKWISQGESNEFTTGENNNDENDTEILPYEHETEIEFSIIREGSNARIQIGRNPYYTNRRIAGFIERLIREKKIPIVFKTTGVIILGISDKAMIEYYEYSENNESGKRKHIIIQRKDYSI